MKQQNEHSQACKRGEARVASSYIIRHPNDTAPSTCAKCLQEKPLSEYYIHSVRGDGAIRYRGHCKGCRARGPRKNWSRPKHQAIVDAGCQTCSACNTSKPLEEFYSNGCFADGVLKYRSRCKVCVLQKSKSDQAAIYVSKSAKRSASPRAFIGAILNHAAKRKQHMGFDLDMQFLMELYESQGGLCAISRVPMTYHAGTGRVRTNISIDRIDSSIGYLRGNVQFVCDCVNRMKQDMTMDEFIHWCACILKGTP